MITSATSSPSYAINRTSNIKASSAYTSVQNTTPTDKMALMMEKYKDVYNPIPEHYSQEIEDLQTSLIRERYPDYLPLEEVMEKYLVPLENPSDEAREKAKIEQDAKIAESLKTEGPNYYNGGLPRDLEREAFIREIMTQYPNNTLDKYFQLSNAPELARVYNAAVYEGLENGESLEDAMSMASQIKHTYIDQSEMFETMFERSRNFFKDAYAQFDKMAEESRAYLEEMGIAYNQEEDGTIKYTGRTLDLREFGFDREVTTLDLFQSNSAMVNSIQNQIKFFDFILNNQDIVQGKYDDLNEDYKEENSLYETVIKPVQDRLPIAQRALDVFSNYKIFDSVDTKA